MTDASAAAASASSWAAPVARMIAAQGACGGFLAVLPEYRPSLVQALAETLGLAFVDFRATYMANLGWEAARLPASALTQAIEGEIPKRGCGIVLHNAEALLAAKSAGERQQWLSGIIADGWSHPVVVPVAIFGAELPAASPRIARLDGAALPPESLLVRLAAR